MKKRQLTGPEPATSRSIADPLAAEPRLPPTSTEMGMVLKRGMDQWMLVATIAHLSKGCLYIDLEVAGSGPVSCHFSFPSLSYHV